MRQNNQRLIFLDWLRIFSFISVLVGHKFINQLQLLSNKESIHESLRVFLKLSVSLCSGGAAGVVVFFLVSGYIITYVLQTQNSFEFLIKRIFRIYPLYIFAVLLQTVLLNLIEHVPVNLHVLIPQLLLIGDFFHVPLTLNQVEWTLRIEILFYLLMFTIHYLKIMDSYKFLLPWILVFMTLLMNYLPLTPGSDFWDYGYLNIYMPFLFLGVMFFLYEKRQITFTFLFSFSCLVYLQFWHLITLYQPSWTNSHYAVLSLCLFIILWSSRAFLSSNALILFFSELTYSVYLFHNWLFDRIKALPIINNDFYALIVLILICAAFVRLIERPGIALGHNVYNYLRSIKKPVNTLVKNY